MAEEGLNNGLLLRRAAFLLLSVSLAVLSVTLAAETPSALWIDVPFVEQPRQGCGAASIEMVMQYWARQQHGPEPPPVERINQQMGSAHGSTPAAMRDYFHSHGYLAFPLSGKWDDLREQLSRGRPVIVALRPPAQRELHFVVIAGINTAQGVVLMNDPAERKLLSEERAQFEQDWSATHNWMLLALPAPAQR